MKIGGIVMETEKLNNTIKLVYDLLEKNKDNPNVKEAYDEIALLAKKRNITN